MEIKGGRCRSLRSTPRSPGTFQRPVYLKNSIPDEKGWGNLKAAHYRAAKAYFPPARPFFSQKHEVGFTKELREGGTARAAARPLREPSQRPTPAATWGSRHSPFPPHRLSQSAQRSPAAAAFFF